MTFNFFSRPSNCSEVDTVAFEYMIIRIQTINGSGVTGGSFDCSNDEVWVIDGITITGLSYFFRS